MNKKILIIIIAIVAIIVAGVGGYYFISTQGPVMKNETIEGITVSIPSETNLTKNAYGVYDDKEVGVQFSVQNSSLELTVFMSTVDGRKDMNRITLENLPKDAIAWKSDEGWINILVVNKDASKGILVGAKDNEGLAIEIANSVKF